MKRIVSRNVIAIGPESQLADLNAYSIYQRIVLLLRVELFVSVSMSVKEESFQRSVPKKTNLPMTSIVRLSVKSFIWKVFWSFEHIRRISQNLSGSSTKLQVKFIR